MQIAKGLLEPLVLLALPSCLDAFSGPAASSPCFRSLLCLPLIGGGFPPPSMPQSQFDAPSGPPSTLSFLCRFWPPCGGCHLGSCACLPSCSFKPPSQQPFLTFPFWLFHQSQGSALSPATKAGGGERGGRHDCADVRGGCRKQRAQPRQRLGEGNRLSMSEKPGKASVPLPTPTAPSGTLGATPLPTQPDTQARHGPSPHCCPPCPCVS